MKKKCKRCEKEFTAILKFAEYCGGECERKHYDDIEARARNTNK